MSWASPVVTKRHAGPNSASPVSTVCLPRSHRLGCLVLIDLTTACAQETLKGSEYKRLSEDVVKHAQYHYNPGKDVVFRGEFITVRRLLLPESTLQTLDAMLQPRCKHRAVKLQLTALRSLPAGRTVQGPLP